MSSQLYLPSSPNKTLVVFVGGALDQRYKPMFAGVYLPYKTRHGSQQDICYIGHHGRDAIDRWVRHWQAHQQSICLIGHSWGAQSVLDVAHKLNEHQCIAYLVTLDPVSRRFINQRRNKPLSVTQWVNVYIDAKRSPFERSNLIARLGGRWNHRDAADTNICLDQHLGEEVTHAKARLMFDYIYPQIAAC